MFVNCADDKDDLNGAVCVGWSGVITASESFSSLITNALKLD